MSRPLTPLTLAPGQRENLRSFSRSRSLTRKMVQRAQVALLAADGWSNDAIARKLGMSNASVGKWRARFLERGIFGLYDKPRPGTPARASDEEVLKLLQRTAETCPSDEVRWTCRSMAEAEGLSKSTVQRVWNAFNATPLRKSPFQISSDPDFAGKVRGIVGLYLGPPDMALALSVTREAPPPGGKRSAKLSPLRPGPVEGLLHNHGAPKISTLFACLDNLREQFHAPGQPDARHESYLRFLRALESQVPRSLDIYVIASHSTTLKQPALRRWLGARARYRVRIARTHGLWLNQVEVWTNLMVANSSGRPSLRATRNFRSKIERYVKTFASWPIPICWTISGDPGSPGA